MSLKQFCLQFETMQNRGNAVLNQSHDIDSTTSKWIEELEIVDGHRSPIWTTCSPKRYGMPGTDPNNNSPTQAGLTDKRILPDVPRQELTRIGDKSLRMM